MMSPLPPRTNRALTTAPRVTLPHRRFGLSPEAGALLASFIWGER